jgi:hypothetical protein
VADAADRYSLVRISHSRASGVGAGDVKRWEAAGKDVAVASSAQGMAVDPLGGMEWSCFATNGPMLELEVDGHQPGDMVEFTGTKKVKARVTARSILRFSQLDILLNGRIVGHKITPVTVFYGDPPKDGIWSMEVETEVELTDSSWLAARVIDHPDLKSRILPRDLSVFAHTNPIYFLKDGAKARSTGWPRTRSSTPQRMPPKPARPPKKPWRSTKSSNVASLHQELKHEIRSQNCLSPRHQGRKEEHSKKLSDLGDLCVLARDLTSFISRDFPLHSRRLAPTIILWSKGSETIMLREMENTPGQRQNSCIPRPPGKVSHGRCIQIRCLPEP